MGGLGTAIIIVIVVTIWVIKGLQAVMGSGDDSNQAQRKRRSLEDWDELQARRRAEMARQRGEEPLEELYAETHDAGPQQANAAQITDPSQMTMAQRIELARQRARQQQQGGGQPQADERGEALRRAQQRAEREAEQRRSQAQREQAQRAQAERERAARERERQVAERRRKAEERARAEREQLRKSRSRRKRSTSGAKQAQAASQPVPVITPAPTQGASYRRVQKGHTHLREIGQGAGKRKKTGIAIGPLDAASLRKAFVMKELLDKPLAMRNPQDDLLS
jgi:hypothetical protein